MDLYYVMIRNDSCPDALPGTVPWSDIRSYFSDRELRGEEPIWVLDGANTMIASCTRVQLRLSDNAVYIFMPAIKKWVAFHIRASKQLQAVLEKNHQILKVYLTRYTRGKKSSHHWFLSFVACLPHKTITYHNFRRVRVNLAPANVFSPQFLDDSKINNQAVSLMMRGVSLCKEGVE